MRNTLAVILVLLLAGCSNDDPTRGPITTASAEIYFVSSDDDITYVAGAEAGSAVVNYQDGVSTLQVSLSGFVPNSSHAMHIHLGTLEVPGRHWNQNIFDAFCNERSLGRVWAKPFAGDVGNIDIDSDGNGSFTIQTDLWSLNTGEDSDIQNTVLYIHENEEDFVAECDPNHSHSHGHSNAKIAGGTFVMEL